MGFTETCEKLNDKFKKDGSLGIDKIIETENAWIVTRKERDDVITYGNPAAVVYKKSQDEALLFTPELYNTVGKTIKETDYKAS